MGSLRARFGGGLGQIFTGLLLGAVGTGCSQGSPPAPSVSPASPGSARAPGTLVAPADLAVRRLPAPQSGAVATGRARLIGKPPPAVLPHGSDPFCNRSQVPDDTIGVDSHGGLSSVLVRVVEGAGGPYLPPTTPVMLTQAGCRYRPRVLGAVRGQPVLVSNSDDTLHNVHALLGPRTVLNQVQMGTAAPLVDLRQVATAAATNPLQLRCDVHPWMTAYLWVLEHPFFAVTAEDGTFAIANLPAGDYVLEAWHERLGTRRAKLSVPPSAAPVKPAQIEFRFTLEATAPAASPEAGKPAPFPTPTGG